MEKTNPKTQRGFAQKIARTYRTASLSAATLLAGLLPLDLRIKESATIYEIKRGIPWEVTADFYLPLRPKYII